jgi:hypothetical protein
MVHKIVSLYAKDLNPIIVELQKKVFDKLEIPLIQIPFINTHGSAIREYLENNEWDLITIFDVDCIPLNSNVINKVLEVVDDNIIYGNAQISNSTPYAAPSFMSFTRNLFETSVHKSFEGAYYQDNNGNMFEADCAEVFGKENLKRGKQLVLSYPTEVIHKKWTYAGNDEYPSFVYGNGTTFDNDTYHNFQIRHSENQSLFIEFIKKFLDEKS